MKKNKKKITKASRRRLIIFGLPSIIMIIYFLMTISVYAIKIYNLKVEKKYLQDNLVDMQAKEKKLTIEIEKLKDREYLAKYARENYQYSKDGELVFSLPEDDIKKIEDAKRINIDTNYILLGGTSIIVLTIIYVLKRHK